MVTTGLLLTLLAQATTPAVSVTVEPRAETLRYRFENPSRYNTQELVPHFFEQTYDTDNVWIGGRVRYRMLGRDAVTSGAVTPQVTALADDFDTFYQPDGNVIVAGTTGNASLRAWTLSQRVTVARTATFAHGLGYVYRRDTADYHEGTRITTMTKPPSELRELVTTREFVTSRIHEVQWFAEWTPRPSLAFTVTASPAVLARLEIELPDKYPGELLRFDAAAGLLSAEAMLSRDAGPVHLAFGLRAAQSFSWREASRLDLSGISLVLRAGTR